MKRERGPVGRHDFPINWPLSDRIVNVTNQIAFRKKVSSLACVMIGSPQEVCNGGVNWVAGLSLKTRQRISQVINTGSAPGMVKALPPQGPCPLGEISGGDAGCSNPE